ncbi:unnamed protein product, partial [Angiostrongylus costaricensis]|uniref:CCHC-type domain-containing protein n=1 Tax=Angiostrongylus costaricensis TaxID=334426 RepID=A0A0R3Q2V7_ANGCS
MADQLQENPNTQAKDELQRTANKNVEKAVEHLDEAERCLSKLIDIGKTLEDTESYPRRESNVHPPLANLPPIPIPKFNGDIREWEALWGALNYNVHSRRMDDLQKMTYLLDALQGEARECVKQYQVSQSTYPIVIQHLKEKYDNKQALIRDLLHRLRTTEAKTERLEDQEKLCETLHSIVVQLQRKGELIDTLLLQQLLLEKFTKEIQRHARQKRRQRAEEARTCELLKDIKGYIKEELELRDREQEKPTLRMEHISQPERTFKTTRYTCFYCNKGGHSPNDCEVIRTQQERVQIIKTRNLCYNCGSSSHQLPCCKAGPCRNCNKHGHHTSICRYQYGPTEYKPRKGGNTTRDKTKAPSKLPIPIPREKKPSSSKINTVTSDKTQPEDTVVLHTRRELVILD